MRTHFHTTLFQVYLDPDYVSLINCVVPTYPQPAMANLMLQLTKVPTFIWLDSLTKVQTQLSRYLADARSQMSRDGQKRLVQIVLYDIPDRECARPGGGGDFTATQGTQPYINYVNLIYEQLLRKSFTSDKYSILNKSPRFSLSRLAHSSNRGT